jgi:3-hydroxymyristoyl/3-hydroxydecanoyl-(acyl carrier protein) dehydratase
METITKQTIMERFAGNEVKHAISMSKIQSGLMDSRQQGLNRLAAQISIEISAPGAIATSARTALFDRNWLNEFALGDITRCLGNEFATYAGRKSPRIPNGDLMLISRILEIDGIPGEFNRLSSISAEYDVSPDAWFFSGQKDNLVPLSILMEIALQPCGVLSAWLHTQLRYPQIDFLFRNLDGALTFLESASLQGKVITTHAVLEKSSFSGSTIIQQFSFRLSCDGRDFLTGNTTFGYFPEETMAVQTGLDNGKKSFPQGLNTENQAILTTIKGLAENPGVSLPHNKLRMIDSIAMEKIKTTGQLEYIQASRVNSPSDWYYANHFLGDPVMPGSLGVETIVQAFTCGIQASSGNPAAVQPVIGREVKWKYRGQVLPANHAVHTDVQIKSCETTSSGTLYTGSANLWADDLRIYEIQDLALIQRSEDN